MKTFQIAMGIRALLTFILSLLGGAQDKAQDNPHDVDVVKVVADKAKPEHAGLEALPGRRTCFRPLSKTAIQSRREIRVRGQDTIVVQSYKMADGEEVNVTEIISSRVR